MSFKKLLILACVLLFLSFLVALKKNAQKNLREHEKEGFESAVYLIKNLPQAFINKIVVYKGEDESEKISFLKDKENNWNIEGMPQKKVKEGAVKGLFKELNNLKGEVRSQTKDIFADFGIEDKDALHLVLFTDNQEFRHLVISYLKPEWGRNFVRLYGSQEVILVEKDILSSLGLWADRSSLADVGGYFIEKKEEEKGNTQKKTGRKKDKKK